MSTAALPLHPLAALWQNLHSRVLFKFILPRLQRVNLEGITLDVSQLSPLMKNNIRTGRYEVQERRLAHRILNPQDVVLELGGAIGFIGLFCRKVIGVKHHLSVEANPATLDLLRRNYSLNHLVPNVIHAAAADKDGQISLDIGGEFWENSIVGNAHPSSKTVTVPALSLQSIVGAMLLPPTTLICDIEGAEQYLDFTQLPASVRKIIIELHPGMTGNAPVTRILQQLAAMGFAERAQEAGTWWLER